MLGRLAASRAARPAASGALVLLRIHEGKELRAAQHLEAYLAERHHVEAMHRPLAFHAKLDKAELAEREPCIPLRHLFIDVRATVLVGGRLDELLPRRRGPFDNPNDLLPPVSQGIKRGGIGRSPSGGPNRVPAGPDSIRTRSIKNRGIMPATSGICGGGSGIPSLLLYMRIGGEPR